MPLRSGRLEQRFGEPGAEPAPSPFDELAQLVRTQLALGVRLLPRGAALTLPLAGEA